MVSLRDRVALVIGGNSGIGKASAFALAEAGARVVIAARREREGLAVVEELQARGAAALFVALDVTIEADIVAGVAATVEKFGRLDCAVNSAGICEDFGPVSDVDGAAFDRMMAVNVRGTLLGMKHQIRQMLAQGGGGSIVNMASFLAHAATPTGSAYVATKHAVLGITRSAALGYAKDGIRVNCVAPTAITGTPMVDDALANYPAVMAPVIAAIPMGRPGRADEVGRAVAWLCSDEASFISGHSLAIDGAQLAG
ncbi:SDR family NAD(P)-dependent oxidoreductase [Nannocystis radixulma]|uniref:Glucose 1-dehydrogenase n=1 Tax=Nannocystis radixulma TaxID=2995305 RepID=A0ABT5BGA1_9BACT|nr:glucose 1-dehydrogenase [Nannocystis radixulma]MDC0672753.1 glucose 1-dehydrogenase [Nannocystis radixulma]